MLESLDLPFVQRGLAEVALLSVGAGLIGTWVLLRGLAFYSHAVGTAAFPGLVLADGLGFAAPLGALGAAAAFAVVIAMLSRGRGDDRGAEVALGLVGMLSLGVILASDVFHTTSGVESLLFGSLLLVDSGDLALAAGVSAAAVAAGLLIGRHWVARGFEGEGEAVVGRSALDLALLGLIALATAAALTAVGALLVAALFVVPAATTRLWASRMRSWQLATIALCAVEGGVGVIVSVELNAPPGATIAVISGLAFAGSAIAHHARARSGAGGLARWAAAGAVVFVLAGCGDDDTDMTRVVATTPVAGDLAIEVAEDFADVRTLIPANADPHDYEPRPDDVKALADADLVIASGGEIDAWIGDAMDESGSDATLLTLTDEIPNRREEDGELDPHWWHDPTNVAVVAPVIADAIAAVDRPYRDVITDQGRRLAQRAMRLDGAVERCVGSIPEAERKLVTDHDALGYFADRYLVEIVGTVIPALTTEAQPSAGELAELREVVEREGVSAVFPEASGNADLANAIAGETGATADYELYGDSLGEEGSDGETWLGAEAANADAITLGLTGGDHGCPGALALVGER